MELRLSKRFYYRILEGDTLQSLCREFNTSKNKILRNNPNIDLYAGEIVLIEVNDYISHFVRPAETLKDIANRYDIDIIKLKYDNNLKQDKLFIGQEIKIFKNNK